jgi:sulfur transfer complex TusBCD TusB component (DsrH family)
MKDKNPITYQLDHLADFLFALELSQINRGYIVKYLELKDSYPSLIYIHNLYRNDICLKYVQLTDLSDSFNILKPINKIVHEFEQNKSEKADNLVELRSVVSELRSICESEFSKSLKSKVRDVYIAHNDLMKRTAITVDMDQLNVNFKQLVELYNRVCTIWGSAPILLDFTQRDTIEKMLKDLS